MLVDLTDAASVRAWLKVAPERHRSILRGLWRIWPQHRAAIEAAVGALPAVADQPSATPTTVTKKAPSGAYAVEVGSRSTTGRRAKRTGR